MKATAILTALVILVATGVSAADWQWPASMSLGGFQISGISGSVNANGSGSATGTLDIPNLGDYRVNLSRSPQGSVSGGFSLDARISGGSLRGSFSISNSGAKGRGSLQCGSQTIDASDMDITNRGEARGGGRLSLGKLNPQVDFKASASSCSFSGEAPVSAQVDTPMASYKLNGRLSVRSSGGPVTASLSGQVQRTGKVSDQVTTTNIQNARVDLPSGQCTVNVGGVSITFSIL